MSTTRISLSGNAYRVVAAVLAALLVLTVLVIVPDAQASDPDTGHETTTTAADDTDPVVEETTTTVPADEEPVVEETTTTVPADEEPVVEETTTTVPADEEPVVEETTTTLAEPEATSAITTTTKAEAEAKEVVEPLVALEEPEVAEPEADLLEDPTYQITFVKRVCDSFLDIRANNNVPNVFVEHAEPVGAPATWLEVTPASEEPAHPNCSPQSGWNFSFGTGIENLTPSLSQVSGNFGASIVTQASTPELDAFGVATGGTVFGAVTYDITPDQWQAGLDSNNGLLSVSEGTIGAGSAVIPDGFEFGALRCGYDNRHGNNVEWIKMFHGNPDATHVYCYAYNVAEPEPDFEIEKDAVDIDGVPYAVGDVALVGQTINYEVTVTNTGGIDFTDLVITDPGLDPPGLTCAWPGPDGELDVGDSVTCTGSHVATDADALAGTYLNTSTAESVEYGIEKDDDEEVPVEEPEVTYQVTFVKRVCPEYDDIRANYVDSNLLVEHDEPIGAPATWLEVTPGSEEPAHPDCSPETGWEFSLGTGIDPISGPLSQVTGEFPVNIVTEASTPELDEFSVPTGGTVEGAVTIDLTEEQWQAGLDSQNGLLSVSEGTTSAGGGVIPEGFGFGALRCGYDSRHGDNVEWLKFFHGNPEATHVYCYAYNVNLTPDFEIEKDAVDIDGVPYVVGDIAQVGQTINYEVTVTNTGNVDFTDVVITDPGLDPPGLTCAWPGVEGTLEVGDSVTCTGSHLTTEADAIVGFYYNESTAVSEEYEIEKMDDEEVPVEGDPAIEVVKTVDKPEIIAKDTVEFTITVTNIGNMTLNNLTLDDVMTYGVGQSEDLLDCEIPDATTLAPGASTQAQCSVELDNTTYGDEVLNTVTADAVAENEDEVSDTADVTVTIIPPEPSFLGAACISQPIEGFGFSLDQPLLEWTTTDWGPTFDPNTDTIELRIWMNDLDPLVDAPTTTYQVPFDSDLLGQEPYASAAGAPTSDRIFTQDGDSYLFWPGYSNTGWLGPENGLAGIVYPGAEWRPTAYQFSFNPETAVVVVEYPPATPDCVPGGAMTIEKLVGPLGTAAGSSDFVDTYIRAVGETEVTWQVTLKNITDYSLFNIFLTDDVAPSCVTAFEAAVQTNEDGNFMTPQEELQFTCDLDVGDETVTNVVEAGGIDLWGSELELVTDFAQTSTDPLLPGSIGDTVWNDINRDGKQDDGEPGMAGIVVELTFPDDSTLKTTTGADGFYLFDNLAPGTYTVLVVESSLPDPGDGHWEFTTAKSFTIDLADGEEYLDADFGLVLILPDTGFNADTVLFAALSLLGLGGAAVLATARRREDDEGTMAA